MILKFSNPSHKSGHISVFHFEAKPFQHYTKFEKWPFYLRNFSVDFSEAYENIFSINYKGKLLYKFFGSCFIVHYKDTYYFVNDFIDLKALSKIYFKRKNLLKYIYT